jgi:hypothetical protein
LKRKENFHELNDKFKLVHLSPARLRCDFFFLAAVSFLSGKKTLEQLKPKPFRARPVPRSHYNEPYRPELPSKKDRQPKIAAKKVDTAHPEFKMVDPISHSNDNVEDTGIAQGILVEKVITAEVSPEAGHTPLFDDAPEKVDALGVLESVHPGLVSRMWACGTQW